MGAEVVVGNLLDLDSMHWAIAGGEIEPATLAHSVSQEIDVALHGRRCGITGYVQTIGP